MQTITKIAINIQVTDGKITYGDQKDCKAKHKYEIEWRAGGPFAIQFRSSTPFEDGSFQSSPGSSGHEQRRIVSEDAPRGRYEYAVAVSYGEKVYLDANCPAIIIE